MNKLYVAIWFPFLAPDWMTRKNPRLKQKPFALSAKEKNRVLATAANKPALQSGISAGMSIADARAVCPGLEVIEAEAGIEQKLLTAMAQWCIRYTPVAAVDGTTGLMLDSTGCCHLWGGPFRYIEEIKKRFSVMGYDVRLALAPTPGAAWALARYGNNSVITDRKEISQAIQSLPASALRIDSAIVQRLHASGLYTIGSFAHMTSASLRRRFGDTLIERMSQLNGTAPEWLTPVEPLQEYTERLPCIEPVFTAVAIEIAIRQLLEMMCTRLQKEQKGLRYAVLKCYRVDHKTIDISIGTGSPGANIEHLFKLFQVKIDTIQPGFGIELFTLTASKVQEVTIVQDSLWATSKGINDIALSELIDRVKMKVPGIQVQRFLPGEHYWPERSFTATTDLKMATSAKWTYTRPRPIRLLDPPHTIIVTAPVPDYPPMSFRYKGSLHKIVKADGPERIEPEWWISQGQHRDYYYVEDEAGHRYWLFRAGHYDADKSYQWYLHGFFA